MKNLNLLVMLSVFTLSGCGGKVEYVRPTSDPKVQNTKLVPKSREAVWNKTIPALGKQFFVINNLDKSSGLVNLSYSGDPEKYVDCGNITSYVSNVRGERTYNFPGARAAVQYEVMDKAGLFIIDRKMSLEGRMNLIFEDAGSNQTRVTASTRYVLTRFQRWQSAGGEPPQERTDTMSFNTGQIGSLPVSNSAQAVECVSTGRLEAEVLSLVE